MSVALWQVAENRVRQAQEDGTLPDIHILNTTRDDWETFVNYIAASSYSATMTDRERELPVALPKDFPGDNMPRLSFTVAGLLCNCFFRDEETIDFDIDVREVREEAQFNQFVSFLADLRDLLGKDILLTEENVSFFDLNDRMLHQDRKLTAAALPDDVIVWLPALKGSDAHAR